MIRWCDRLITGGILFLIVSTPFAFGAVQPWAYSAMEAIIFALVIVWMAKLIAIRGQRSEVGDQAGAAWSTEHGAAKIRNSQSEIRNCALPLALFLTLCVMQLLPLPPAVLQAISPQTFEVYKQSLPGWPGTVLYSELGQRSEVGGQRSEGGDQRSEIRDQRLEAGDQGSEVSDQRSEVGAETPSGNEQSAKGATRENVNNATNANNATNTRHPPPDTELHAPSSLFPATWLPLSISPGLTKVDLLKFASFAALFFLLWRYPFEEPFFEDLAFRNSDFGISVLSPEQRFLRSVVCAILATGLLVAAFGFIERFAWNGNILLLAAGYDHGAPAANSAARAAGPFINPDHFANYLSLIFPLALGCACFRTFMVPPSHQYGLKIFSGFSTFLLFTGILLSLSRGAWISTLFGIAIFAWLSPWGGVAGGRRSEVRGRRAGSRSGSISDFGFRISIFFPSGSKLNPQSEIRNSKLARMARLSLVTVCILLIVSLFFAGQGGREQVDARLGATMEQTDLGLGARIDVILRDMPKMIKDFPLLGVGLGAWPELFLRYRSGPWSSKFYREAHNDYLEVTAETGLIGLALLAVFFAVAGRRLCKAVKTSSAKYLPLIAAILAALGGMAVHEWLDFSLQIPANAFLFTVLLALGLRMAKGKEQGAGSSEQEAFQRSGVPAFQQHDLDPQWSEIRDQTSGVRGQWSAFKLSRFRAFQPAVVAIAALFLTAMAIGQDQTSYPQNIKDLTSLNQAQELLLEHPTHSPYHLALVRLAGADAPLEWQLTEAKAALWNEPVNPYYRDFYAATLIAMGNEAEGLKEVTRSVTESPSFGTHAYLSPESLPSLSDEEQAAVEGGFKEALARSYPGAITGLAEFYLKLERFADQAELYEQAAVKETDGAKKSELLMNAGAAYLRAADAQAPEVRGQRSEVAGQQSKEQEAFQRPRLQASQQTERGRTSSVVGQRGDAINAKNAVRLFRAAIAVNPGDPKPYQQLVMNVFAMKKDLDGARELVAEGIKNGAPPLPLYLSLAEAAQKSGDQEEVKAALESAKAEIAKLIKNGESPYTLYMVLAEGARKAGERDHEAAALLKALDLQPRSPETLGHLASVYAQKQNYDRAALYLNRIAQVKPDSAEVYFGLAQTEESRYRFADAGRAYARAVELAPKNDSYRKGYEDFKFKVDRNRVTEDRGPQVTATRETGDR